MNRCGLQTSGNNMDCGKEDSFSGETEFEVETPDTIGQIYCDKGDFYKEHNKKLIFDTTVVQALVNSGGMIL